MQPQILPQENMRIFIWHGTRNQTQLLQFHNYTLNRPAQATQNNTPTITPIDQLACSHKISIEYYNDSII